jgi:hypothetical protein
MAKGVTRILEKLPTPVPLGTALQRRLLYLSQMREEKAMNAFFEGTTFQMISAFVGFFVWMSAGISVVICWYAKRPLRGPVAAIAAMGCAALALQVGSIGIKLIMPIIRSL